jgi:hypothetical protein
MQPLLFWVTGTCWGRPAAMPVNKVKDPLTPTEMIVVVKKTKEPIINFIDDVTTFC